jgi:hypothetical protein
VTSWSSNQELSLERDELRVQISLRPFAIRDAFVQSTEGVIPNENLAPPERAMRPRPVWSEKRAAELVLTLQGGREVRLRVELPDRDRVVIECSPAGEPLRVALDWDRRAEEHFAGLGARHGPMFDQSGRDIQLGADRRYTGPDCPPEMLAEGGIPQGTARPCRGCSRAGATPSGCRPTPTARGSNSRESASPSPRARTPGHRASRS